MRSSMTLTMGSHVTLGDQYRRNAFVLSYELFPPKTDPGMDALADHLRVLAAFKPNFITCTYGAGGSTRDKTLATLARVREIIDVPLASHLTCVGATADDLRRYLEQAAAQGIAYIVAIRGDAPKDQPEFRPVKGGLRYANELVALIRKEFPRFGVAVGGYPEKHPEALNAKIDLDNLKRKVDAGADVVITQLFYDNDDFLRFRDNCDSAGITVPVVPGLLPITNFKQIERIASLCGATLPKAVRDHLEDCADDAEAQFRIGVEHARTQIAGLLREGVPGIHFYVLNQSRATAALLQDCALPR